MRERLFIFLFVCVSSLWSQRLSEKRVGRQVQKIEAFQKAHVAISISPLEGATPMAQYQAAHYMTPASNTKLLTFLGASQQFKELPAVSYFKEKDSIIHFKSTGYPLLFHPFYKDTILDAFFNQKGLWNYHVNKDSPKPHGSGWAWDDYSYYYAAETSVFPIYGNTLQAQIDAKELKMSPSFFASKTILDSLGKAFKRAYDRNTFHFNPAAWTAGDTLYRPFITSDSLFVKLLEHEIGQPVQVADGNSAEPQWNFLYTAAEETLYSALLQDSDNGIAEALLLMISQKNFNGMTPEKAIALLLDQWKPWLPDPIAWVDGSGISRYNMITPRTVVRVLQKIHETVGWQIIESYFPKGATSGTLKKYSNTALYAKTGTLRHNHNLSGYWVHPKGETFVFSIMVNHHTASTAEVREGIGTLLEWFERKLR